MNIYKVMMRDLLNGNQYAESYWQKKENAEAHMEHLKLSDDGSDGLWNYWVAKIETKD